MTGRQRGRLRRVMYGHFMGASGRLSAEDVERRRAEYRASWEAQQRRRQDPEKMAYLRAQLERLEERDVQARTSPT